MSTLVVEEKKELEPRFITPFRPDYFENPLNLMRRFSNEMDRLFGDFGFRPKFFEKPIETTVWVPDIEVFEREGQFIVRADLPGLTKDEVKVGITDELLTLEGERKQIKEEKREGYFRTERNYGVFYRAIPLPEGVKAEKILANFKNGVLEVTMPLVKEEKKVKKIEVKQL